MTFEARKARRIGGDKKFYCCIEECAKTALYVVGKSGYCGDHRSHAVQRRTVAMSRFEHSSRGGAVRNTKQTFMRQCIDNTLFRAGKRKPTAKLEQAVATQ